MTERQITITADDDTQRRIATVRRHLDDLWRRADLDLPPATEAQAIGRSLERLAQIVEAQGRLQLVSVHDLVALVAEVGFKGDDGRAREIVTPWLVMDHVALAKIAMPTSTARLLKDIGFDPDKDD